MHMYTLMRISNLKENVALSLPIRKLKALIEMWEMDVYTPKLKQTRFIICNINKHPDLQC